jgi:hypothetical protein
MSSKEISRNTFTLGKAFGVPGKLIVDRVSESNGEAKDVDHRLGFLSFRLCYSQIVAGVDAPLEYLLLGDHVEIC